MSGRNPYEATKAPLLRPQDEERVHRPAGLIVLASVATFVAAAGAAIAPGALLAFREMFRGFGAELPALTRVVLGSRYVWLVLGAVAVGLLLRVCIKTEITPAERRRMTFGLVAFLVLYGVLIAVSWFALYLPIFKLGAVV